MANQPLVCNVAGPVLLPGQTLAPLQPVPRATNLASALAALAVLTHNFNVLNAQLAHASNQGTGVSSGLSGGGGGASSTWVEDKAKRVTATVKISNPDDPSQFVEVEQISSYTMKNKNSKDTFKWTQ